MDSRAIGIFDSGVGGLTVLKEYLSILPNENYIYFGDTARLPYGSKSEETIIEFSKQITSFLVSKDVKLVVIACGTASAIAYNELKKSFDIPIIDIITPTAKNIATSSVGVIATKATIKNNSWEREIHTYKSDTAVYSVACPLFVPIVEEGFSNSEIANLVVRKYLSKFDNHHLDSLIMGCTHYPVLEPILKQEISKDIKLINPGFYSALYAKDYLENNGLINTENTPGKLEFYSSDDEVSFREAASAFFNLNNHTVQRYRL